MLAPPTGYSAVGDRDRTGQLDGDLSHKVGDRDRSLQPPGGCDRGEEKRWSPLTNSVTPAGKN